MGVSVTMNIPLRVNKYLLSLVIFILVSGLLLTGCNGGEMETTAPATGTSQPAMEITTTSPPVTTPTTTSKTYYVKNGGNDNASGLSDAEAWATLSKVENSQFNPGDKILLKCGSTWDERLDFPSSGAPDKNILFTSYGTGEQPKIMRLYIDGKSFLNLSNIHMLGDRKYQALIVKNSNNLIVDGITVDGQKIMNVERVEPIAELASFFYCHDVIIKNSTFKDSGNQKETEWGGGLGMNTGCHDFLVENNLAYNHANFAIQVGSLEEAFPCYNVTIRGNTVYNEEGYYADCRGINFGWWVYDIIVENNIVSNTGTMLIGADGLQRDGIIRNNLLFYTIDSGYSSFIDILSYDGNQWIPHGDHYTTYVYNNSMFHLSQVACGSFFLIRTYDCSKNIGHKLYNNLCVSYNPEVVFINDYMWCGTNPDPPPSEFTSDYNFYYSMIPSGPFVYRNVKYNNIEDWREASGQDMHSIYANPLLSGIENYDDSIAYTTAGNELISNPSFDYNIDGWGCWFDTAGGASGSISRTTNAGEYATSPGGLKLFCSNVGNATSSIQLYNTAGLQIENNKWYILSFKAKASSRFKLPDINLTQMHSPWSSYTSGEGDNPLWTLYPFDEGVDSAVWSSYPFGEVGDTPIITTEWKTYNVFFHTNQAANDARITWLLGNTLPAGGTLYIDDVSFKLADGLNNSVLPDIEDFVTPPNSPCVDAGITLSDVIDDFLGNHRPQGAGYDIGAYECQ
jgi:hypothetical protein